MLNYWSNVKAKPPEPPSPTGTEPLEHCSHHTPMVTPQSLTEQQRLSMVWVEFGCAGHGKGPWDGLGAVIKQTVRRDILHISILTASGYITSPA